MRQGFLRSSRYSPGNMDRESLEALFVGRGEVMEDVLSRVTRSVASPEKHFILLVGPRGSGKTHFLAVAYHRLMERLQADNAHDRVSVALLNEEEWGVASYLDLIVRIPACPCQSGAGARFRDRRHIRQIPERSCGSRGPRGRSASATHPRQDTPPPLREPRGSVSRFSRRRSEAVASDHSGGRQLVHPSLHSVALFRRQVAGQSIFWFLHYPRVKENRLRHRTRAASQEGRSRGKDGARGLPPHPSRPRPRAGHPPSRRR